MTSLYQLYVCIFEIIRDRSVIYYLQFSYLNIWNTINIIFDINFDYVKLCLTYSILWKNLIKMRLLENIFYLMAKVIDQIYIYP